MNSIKWWRNILGLAVVGAFLVSTALRLWGLGAVPVSLYWEEAALGYDSYSLLKTGKDHHGNAWPIVAVESFGDWKPSGYFYALMPFIQIFGLREWVVRLPSALAGIAIVAAVGVMAGRLARVGVVMLPKKYQELVIPVARLMGVVVAGLSPWGLQFARAAFEANLATALLAWAVIFAWWLVEEAARAPKLSWKHWLSSCSTVVLLVASLYTYHSARVVVPLLFIGLSLWWVISLNSHEIESKKIVGLFSRVKKWLPMLLVAGLTGVVLASPLLVAVGSTSTTQRFAETSIFSDLSVIERSNELKEAAGNAWWARLLYHRYVLFGEKVLENYLSHWNPGYLFVNGDSNPRHSTQIIGTLYIVDAAVLIGSVWLFFYRKWQNKAQWWFMAWWVGVGVVPAAITLAAPHALRTLLMMPALLAIMAAGGTLLALELIGWILFHTEKVKTLSLTPWLRAALCVVLVTVIEGAYVVQFVRYWHYYTAVYPVQYAHEWQYGYKEVIQILTQYQERNPATPVFFSREAGRPAMYYWFFTQTNPTKVQALDSQVPQDQGEYLAFENISFIRSLGEIKGQGLLVLLDEEWQLLQSEGKLQTRIVAETKPLRAGQPYWIVAEVL